MISLMVRSTYSTPVSCELVPIKIENDENTDSSPLMRIVTSYRYGDYPDIVGVAYSVEYEYVPIGTSREDILSTVFTCITRNRHAEFSTSRHSLITTNSLHTVDCDIATLAYIIGYEYMHTTTSVRCILPMVFTRTSRFSACRILIFATLDHHDEFTSHGRL